jgi:hypothetical protein
MKKFEVGTIVKELEWLGSRTGKVLEHGDNGRVKVEWSTGVIWSMPEIDLKEIKVEE